VDEGDGAQLRRTDDRDKGTSWRPIRDLTSSSGPFTRWVVASGLTQPEDFTLLYQSLQDSERRESPQKD
jgi:hypothetical protein